MYLTLLLNFEIFHIFVSQVNIFLSVNNCQRYRNQFSIDLEKMKLESCHESKIEHFIFTLTDSKGNRMYGICLRGLFKGINKRFDISRRRRQCLCIISKRPFFSMFRVMLLQLHSLALLDKDTGSDNDAKSLKCWRFLESVYRQSLSINPERSLSILVQWDAHPDLLLMRTINLILPKQRGLALQRDVKLLPLFEVLGSDRFFKLLSAILCEQRIIFIADEVLSILSPLISTFHFRNSGRTAIIKCNCCSFNAGSFPMAAHFYSIASV